MRDDPESPFNYEKHPVVFAPLKYFEPRADWVFESRLEVYPDPESVTIFDTKGRERNGHLYGHLSFTRDGVTHKVRVYRMEARDEVYYAIWFTDLTTGESTYEVGRYLDFELSDEVDHVYTLDFNMAYNPWCAYSPAYGCAIPRKDDFIDLAIEAGEKEVARLRFGFDGLPGRNDAVRMPCFQSAVVPRQRFDPAAWNGRT